MSKSPQHSPELGFPGGRSLALEPLSSPPWGSRWIPDLDGGQYPILVKGASCVARLPGFEFWLSQLLTVGSRKLYNLPVSWFSHL